MSVLEHGQESYQSQSLAENFGECIDEYSQLLFALSEENCQVVNLKQISVEQVLDGYGRLKVWGEQNKATLPASTRGSLDDVLRHDDSLHRSVAQILNRLIHQIEAALSIASQKIGDAFESETKSTSGPDSGSDSEYSSGSSEESYASTERLTPRQRPPKIAVLMTHIQEQIKLLYHLDALLHRPRVSGRYLKSTNENQQVSLMEKYDYAHVEEKTRQWITSLKSNDKLDTEGQPGNALSQSSKAQVYKTWDDEPVISQDVLQARESSQKKDSNHNIISRLARANTRRREQLRYWKKHPFRKGIQEVASVTNKEPRVPLRGLDLSRDMDFQPPISLTSVPTVQSFSTVAKSAIDEAKTVSGRSRTVYTSSVAAGRQSARVPDIPKAAFEEDQVECPFCHTMLDSATIKSRMSWKRHVFRDLRPYTCTYDNCANPDKMYVTRHDWVYHEMQMHRRRWKCQKCDVDFHDKISMVDHLKRSHNEFVTSQLAIFLEMSERPLDDDYHMGCVLCPVQLSLSRLLDHLAQHMEEIALFVLPSLSDEDEEASSNAARMSRNQDRKASEGDTKTPDSSLGFSDIDWTERPRQDAKVFTRLIESRGCEVEDKPDQSDDADPTQLDKFLQFQQLVKDFEAEVEQKVNVVGKEDKDTLETMRRLTVAYQEIGEYEAARVTSVQFIDGCKKVFGETDPMTMEGVVQLAFSHRRLKNLDEAERLMLEVLEVDKKERGEQHRETLKNQRDLSKVYIEAARWDDAEEMLTKTAEVMAEVLGENHKDTLEAQTDLALTYANQGRLEDAEKLGNWALQQVRLNIPENYKVWLRALDSMARIYWAQGRKDEACATYRETIDWMIRWHGLESPLTLEAIEDLKELENQLRDT